MSGPELAVGAAGMVTGGTAGVWAALAGSGLLDGATEVAPERAEYETAMWRWRSWNRQVGERARQRAAETEARHRKMWRKR